MATITRRTTSDGRVRFRALVRIKRKGQILHQESKTFDTRKLAETWAKKLEVKLSDTDAIDNRKLSQVKIGLLISKYLDEVDKIKAIGRSRKFALQQMLKYPISEIRYQDFETQDVVDFCIQRRNNGAGKATIKADISHLRVVLEIAKPFWSIPVSTKVIDEVSPTLKRLKLIANSKVRTRRPAFSELLKLCRAFKKRQNRPQNEIPILDIFLFAIASAMRQGEICRIEWSDVDFDKKTVIIRERKDPKNKELNDQVVPLLGIAFDLLVKQPRIDKRVFPYNSRSVSSAMTRTAKKAEIKDLRFHDMRHEGISSMFERGYGIQEVAIVSGHKDWNQLKRYTQIKPESLHR